MVLMMMLLYCYFFLSAYCCCLNNCEYFFASTFWSVTQMELCAGLLDVPGAAVVGCLHGAVVGLGRLASGEQERQRTIVALRKEY